MEAAVQHNGQCNYGKKLTSQCPASDVDLRKRNAQESRVFPRGKSTVHKIYLMLHDLEKMRHKRRKGRHRAEEARINMADFSRDYAIA